ncbi:SidA/IucD/PvdA family monooxygenase [Streptacidiphilus sp. PAMC 29251]
MRSTAGSCGPATGSEIFARDLVIGGGRDALVPAEFTGLPAERVIHSTEFATRIGKLDPDGAHRVAVIGGAQSAAEMLWSVHKGFPRAECTMIARSVGLPIYEVSKFINLLYYNSFIDEFYDAPAETRELILKGMHRSNYAGVTTPMVENLYRETYLERLTGTERLHITSLSEVVSARMAGDEVVLDVLDRKSGKTTELRCDVVLLGTGYVREMPAVVTGLAAAVGLDSLSVDRQYRVELPEDYTASVYLQGVNEATHGIADSLLSVVAFRSQEIVQDLLARRTGRLLLESVTRPTEGALL